MATALDILATRIADRCLTGVQIGTTGIDLEPLAARLNVSVRRGIDCSLGAIGFDVDALITQEPDQLLFPVCDDPRPEHQTIYYRPDLPEIPLRFVLAHELAHAVLDMPEFCQERLRTSDAQIERICNRAAEEILLPRQLLENVCVADLAHLSVSTLERLRSQLKVGITLIVKRLGSLAFRGVIRVYNGVIIASNAPARRSKREYAPRVLTACFPEHLFVPFNKRLATLGLECLEDAYKVAPLYSEQGCRGTIRAWHSVTRRQEEYDIRLRFKCYMSGGAHSQRTRLLVATCIFGDPVDNCGLH